jgi:hypothetical protein
MRNVPQVRWLVEAGRSLFHNENHMKTFQLISVGMASVLSLSFSGCGTGPREKKIEFVHLALAPATQPEWEPRNGFHPNDAGHREIARLFLQAILVKLSMK